MESVNMLTIIAVVTIAAALVIFLVWKNQQDKKTLNPDADDAVDETIGDKDRRRDKM